MDWFVENYGLVKFVFHLGARTDTTEQNVKIFTELNLNYSKSLFSICSKHQIPIIYASSAATYGKGEFGYNDQYPIQQLKPLNPYGWSKQNFDLWVKEQNEQPPFWAGLKFFNVYGPNEYHKGRMASVIFHAYHQIKNTGGMKLFRTRFNLRRVVATVLGSKRLSDHPGCSAPSCPYSPPYCSTESATSCGAASQAH